MIFNQVELHNVAETQPWGSGHILYRYPVNVRAKLNPRGRFISEECAGSEIRFVTPAPMFHVVLGSLRGTLEVTIMCGDLIYSTSRIAPGDTLPLMLEVPEKFDKVPEKALYAGRFDSQVWRVVMGRGLPVLHALQFHEYPVRPPLATEKPARRWLAYGSSITNGGQAELTATTYVQQAARRLKVDAINLGLSGACHIEPEAVDYIASRDDWDFATCELGINVLGRITVEEFEKRCTYLVHTLRQRKPNHPLVLITGFSMFHDISSEPADTRQKWHTFREILRKLAKVNDPNLHVIEGTELLSDVTGLRPDLVHPSDWGMIEMGTNLATQLTKLGLGGTR